MAKYVCSVCGYIFDEAKGIPEAGLCRRMSVGRDLYGAEGISEAAGQN